MSKLPLWVTIALRDREQGLKEIPGSGAHPRIIAAHALTTLKATSDEVSWCSSYMCLLMYECGLPYTPSAAARSWYKYGNKLDKNNPVEGAIVVLRRGGSEDPNDEGPGHVGIYMGEGSNGKIRVLGGNQSDAVTITEMSNANVFAYVWPKEYPLP